MQTGRGPRPARPAAPGTRLDARPRPRRQRRPRGPRPAGSAGVPPPPRRPDPLARTSRTISSGCFSAIDRLLTHRSTPADLKAEPMSYATGNCLTGIALGARGARAVRRPVNMMRGGPSQPVADASCAARRPAVRRHRGDHGRPLLPWPLAWSSSTASTPARATTARRRSAVGERRSKADLRVEAYGTVDETNAALGLARLATGRDGGAGRCHAGPHPERPVRPRRRPRPAAGRRRVEGKALRITQHQVDRLEAEIDELNAELAPLRSFVLPGGSEAAAALHLARTVCRRAERLMVALGRPTSPSAAPALRYVNRLSDFLFVAARWVNDKGATDVLWVPGKNR